MYNLINHSTNQHPSQINAWKRITPKTWERLTISLAPDKDKIIIHRQQNSHEGYTTYTDEIVIDLRQDQAVITHNTKRPKYKIENVTGRPHKQIKSYMIENLHQGTWCENCGQTMTTGDRVFYYADDELGPAFCSSYCAKAYDC